MLLLRTTNVIDSQLHAQAKLIFETTFQKYSPWMVASLSSSSDGLREPSAPAKVPAPQGEPERNALERTLLYILRKDPRTYLLVLQTR